MNVETLPLNCEVDYYHDFLSAEDAWELYELLVHEYDLPNQRRIVETGSGIIDTNTFKILFVTQELKDRDSHPEKIHGKSFVWSGLMKTLKENVEHLTGKTFDMAMALYYPNGNHFAEYHIDQKTSGDETILPSLSLGEIREFCFKDNKTKDIYSLDLNHGSLLVMGRGSQDHYMHSLPKNSKYKNGRINVTFREPNFQ